MPTTVVNIDIALFYVTLKNHIMRQAFLQPCFPEEEVTIRVIKECPRLKQLARYIGVSRQIASSFGILLFELEKSTILR